jgi:DHA2 family multidrug resistance protein
MTASAAIDEPVYRMTPVQRALAVVSVLCATTIYTASVFVSSALLPQLQGALLATQDEISWVMTFNIVATAVATPTTGWLVARLGRHTTMLACIVVFSLATFLCGAAGSLDEMILWRIVQGAAGAPLIPLGQTLLLDFYARRQHGMIISIFGMANILGPAIGPMFAGQIAETLGWRWGFWMTLPVALVAAIGTLFALPRDQKAEGRARLDWIGFLSLSIAIGAAQVVLSRGQRLDWFQSEEILAATFAAALAFYVFLAHSLTAARPFISLTLFRDRNYSVGLLLVAVFGMLNFAPIVIMPPLLQQHAGFPDSLVGELIGWRGIGAFLGFLAAMPLARLDPRFGLLIGGLLQTLAGAWLMTLNLDVSVLELNLNSVLQGFAIGLAWAPMTVIAFATLAPELRAEGMSVFHLLRNFSSSLFISILVAEIVRNSGANYARLSEHVSVFNRVLEMPWAMGAWTVDTLPGLARIAGEVNRQATMLGYSNAFLMFTITAALALPLVLLVRVPRRMP